jgi:superfamily I DNA/RNA helicase
VAQLLRYIHEIYIKTNFKQPVVPVILYHGRKKWNIARSISKKMKLDDKTKKNFHPCLLDYRYILVNLALFDIKKIRGSLTLRVILYLFKNIYDFSDEKELEKFLLFARDIFFLDDTSFLQRILIYIYRMHEI